MYLPARQSVTLLVRGASLERAISSYLIQQITDVPGRRRLPTCAKVHQRGGGRPPRAADPAQPRRTAAGRSQTRGCCTCSSSRAAPPVARRHHGPGRSPVRHRQQDLCMSSQKPPAQSWTRRVPPPGDQRPGPVSSPKTPAPDPASVCAPPPSRKDEIAVMLSASVHRNCGHRATRPACSPAAAAAAAEKASRGRRRRCRVTSANCVACSCSRSSPAGSWSGCAGRTRSSFPAGHGGREGQPATCFS